MGVTSGIAFFYSGNKTRTKLLCRGLQFIGSAKSCFADAGIAVSLNLPEWKFYVIDFL